MYTYSTALWLSKAYYHTSAFLRVSNKENFIHCNTLWTLTAAFKHWVIEYTLIESGEINETHSSSGACNNCVWVASRTCCRMESKLRSTSINQALQVYPHYECQIYWERNKWPEKNAFLSLILLINSIFLKDRSKINCYKCNSLRLQVNDITI